MPKHRGYAIEFKRQVAQEYLAGDTLHARSRSPLPLPRQLPQRCWITQAAQ
jgi:hypothetical protein